MNQISDVDRAADSRRAGSAESRPPPRPRGARRSRRAGFDRGVRRGFPRDREGTEQQGRVAQGNPRRHQPAQCAPCPAPSASSAVRSPTASATCSAASPRPSRSRSSARISTSSAQLGIEVQSDRENHSRLRGREARPAVVPFRSSASRRTATAPRAYGITPGALERAALRAARRQGTSPSCAKASARSISCCACRPSGATRRRSIARAAHRDRRQRPAHPALARRRRARGERPERHLPRKQPAPLRHRDQTDACATSASLVQRLQKRSRAKR